MRPSAILDCGSEAHLIPCFALPQMLPGTVLSWIGGGISDPGESNAVQSVRS